MVWGAPYHTTNPQDWPVFHVYSECAYGLGILPENRRVGTGGHQTMCSHCYYLWKEARRP